MNIGVILETWNPIMGIMTMSMKDMDIL